MADTLGAGRPSPYRVMTVCTGNICRSPMAEVVLRDRFEAAGFGGRVVVDSTGISSEEHGNPIDPRARAALRARGYDVPVRSARRVRAEDLVAADLVLAMTEVHAQALRRIAGARDDVVARVAMLRSFDPLAPTVVPGAREHVLDVEDPWYGGPEDFEVCLTQLEAAADGVVARVGADLAGRPAGT